MEVLENLLPNFTPCLDKLHSLADPEQIAPWPNVPKIPKVTVSGLCEVKNPLNSIAAGEFKIRSFSFPCEGFDVNENESSAISAVTCWQGEVRDSSKTLRNLREGEARWSLTGRCKEERVDPHRPIFLHCLNSPQLKKKNSSKTSPATLKAWYPKLHRDYSRRKPAREHNTISDQSLLIKGLHHHITEYKLIHQKRKLIEIKENSCARPICTYAAEIQEAKIHKVAHSHNVLIYPS